MKRSGCILREIEKKRLSRKRAASKRKLGRREAIFTLNRDRNPCVILPNRVFVSEEHGCSSILPI